MERLKESIEPDKFSKLSVLITSSEIVKFDAELSDRTRLNTILSKLTDRRFKFPGFTHLLTVKASEVKPDFPTRHDWDSFFRNNPEMNERKPGERPDTIHIENLPVEWLTEPGDKVPSECKLKEAFEMFGEISQIDLPAADPSRVSHIVGICDAFIQYKEYSSFVKAMGALKGSKLAYISDDKALSANIKVDFDKSKHMTISSVTKRLRKRKKFLAKVKLKQEEERIAQEKELKNIEGERKKKLHQLEKKKRRRKLREEKRRAVCLKKLADEEAEKINRKIAIEDKYLIAAQRKLESIHLLRELLTRIKANIISTNKTLSVDSLHNSAIITGHKYTGIELAFRQRMIEKWKPNKIKQLETSGNQTISNQGLRFNNWRGRGRGRGILGRYLMPHIVDPLQSIKNGLENPQSNNISQIEIKSSTSRSRSKSKEIKQKRSTSNSSRSFYYKNKSQSKSSKNRSRSRSRSRNWRSRSRSRSWRRSRSRSWRSRSSSWRSRSKSWRSRSKSWRSRSSSRSWRSRSWRSRTRSRSWRSRTRSWRSRSWSRSRSKSWRNRSWSRSRSRSYSRSRSWSRSSSRSRSRSRSRSWRTRSSSKTWRSKSSSRSKTNSRSSSISYFKTRRSSKSDRSCTKSKSKSPKSLKLNGSVYKHKKKKNKKKKKKHKKPKE
ncbi:micronuclear linker histone polyprotein isoform X2 [Daktulosphaira vitifoliae]|nr:micronuclear linker histone polyprotein isoform X2 [Daktulosphaira vitifoliae]XP_050532003.1 micronuclear linker histone polyprotein isoform X2 [Daktulosphaira vitifoliae]XP_050532004.1 micronuclear linker histone polyprotein isoform X2 [Daktulosphaira vitifoliae]